MLYYLLLAVSYCPNTPETPYLVEEVPFVNQGEEFLERWKYYEAGFERGARDCYTLKLSLSTTLEEPPKQVVVWRKD